MTYYVCEDHYGKPNINYCFWVNKRYVIKAWKETRVEHKFGTEFGYEENTYYMGELSLGNHTQTFHFMRPKDFEDFTENKTER